MLSLMLAGCSSNPYQAQLQSLDSVQHEIVAGYKSGKITKASAISLLLQVRQERQTYEMLAAQADANRRARFGAAMMQFGNGLQQYGNTAYGNRSVHCTSTMSPIGVIKTVNTNCY